MVGPDLGEVSLRVDFSDASENGDEEGRGCTASDATALPGAVDGSVTNDVIAEIISLVRVVIPHEISNVDDLLLHFDGREENLRDTLRRMCERETRISGADDATRASRYAQAEKEARASSLSTIAESGDGDNTHLGTNFEESGVYIEYDPEKLSGGSSMNETESDHPRTLSVGSSLSDIDEEIGLTRGKICLVPSVNIQDVDAAEGTHVFVKRCKSPDPALPMPWCEKIRMSMYSCVALMALLAITVVLLVVLLREDSPTNNDNDQSIASSAPVYWETTAPSSMPSTPPVSIIMSRKPSSAATGTTNATTTNPSPMQSMPPALMLISTKPSTAATTANEATPVAASTTTTPTLFPTRFSTSSATANISANDTNTPSIPTPSPSASCYPVEITILYDAFPFGTGYVIEEAATVASSFSFFPSDDSLAYQYHRQSLCFEKGLYTFTMYDKRGDGLCCANGIGEYVVSSNGVTLIQGGEFLMKEETPFELPA
jgi:hypothetical protein